VKATGEAYRVVTGDYFDAVGITVRRGRALNSGDTREAPAVVVNEALIRKYYPNEDPLGRLVYMGSPENRLFHQAPIVGVVSDTRDVGLGTAPLPTVYIPLAVMPTWHSMSYVLRTAQEPTSLTAAARRVIHELDPALPVQDIRTMDDVVAAAVAPARWSSALLGVFAGVALTIAVLGVFGVLSFIVTQRTRELGIRIALGAGPGQVRRLVVGRGLALVAAGIFVGLLGSIAMTRFMGSLLYGVTATDPITYLAVAALLASAALVASYLPARRATRVDPILALRAE
jgi:predicted permease